MILNAWLLLGASRSKDLSTRKYNDLIFTFTILNLHFLATPYRIANAEHKDIPIQFQMKSAIVKQNVAHNNYQLFGIQISMITNYGITQLKLLRDTKCYLRESQIDIILHNQ